MSQPPRKMSFRYHEPTGAEGAVEPGSRGRVPANLRGITSKRALDLAEYEALLAAQEHFATTLTAETRFTAELLRAMHREWLGGFYGWAGQYRTVELQKGSFAWPPAHRVAENMAIFERDTLAHLTPCRAGSLEDVADNVAVVHADLLLIHPFRDGNGRLARWLADLMFAQAGFTIPDYGFVGRGSVARRQAYLHAVTRAYLRDYAPLRTFFVEAIRRREGGATSR